MAKGIKTGGRDKGTPNKVTQTHRELIQTIFDNELRSGRIESELKKIEGKEYLEIIIKLTGFVLPKLNSIDVNDNNIHKPIIIDWSEPPKINLPPFMQSYLKMNGEE